jgi:iron(III) transport system substrate-binding protein
MRRYLPLLLISFFLVVITFVGTTFLAGSAGKDNHENVKSILVYTTIPLEQATALTAQYEKETGVRVNLVPLAPSDVAVKLGLEKATPKADLVLTDQTVLEQLKKQKLLTAYDSEQTDMVPEKFCDDDGYWVGTWYDPVVLAANRDFLKTLPQPPTKWSDLAKMTNYRLVITDFLAADASANLLYTLTAVNGETETLAFLGKIHPRIVQYAKFLATPPRMVGLGEADIAIVVQSEALRYVKDNFPLQVIYPEEGTAYLLTGVALVSGAPHSSEAKQFIDWLLQDAAQTALQNNKFYLVPTNPDIKAYKEYSGKDKHLTLFDYEDKLTPEQKSKLLDKWVQTVRLSPR